MVVQSTSNETNTKKQTINRQRCQQNETKQSKFNQARNNIEIQKKELKESKST